MKKAGFGCLIVILLLIAGLAVGGYFLYKQYGENVTQLASFTRDYQKLLQETPRQPGWSPPAGGVMTPGQVNQLVEVESRVLDALREVVTQLEDRWQDVQAKLAELEKTRDLRALVEAGRGLTDLVLSYKRIQIQELKRAGLSLEEYNWLRGEAVLLMVTPEAFSGEEAENQVSRLRIHPENAALLTPHRELLQQTLPLAFIDSILPGAGMVWPEQN